MLTEQETIVANMQGWMLAEVWCLKNQQLSVQVLATSTGPLKNSHDAGQFVVQRARAMDAVAVRALKFVAGTEKPTKRKGK